MPQAGEAWAAVRDAAIKFPLLAVAMTRNGVLQRLVEEAQRLMDAGDADRVSWACGSLGGNTKSPV